MPIFLLALGAFGLFFFTARSAGANMAPPVTCAGIAGNFATAPAFLNVGDKVILDVKGGDLTTGPNSSLCFMSGAVVFNVQATVLEIIPPSPGGSPEFVYGITASDVPPALGFHVGTTHTDFISAVRKVL